MMGRNDEATECNMTTPSGFYGKPTAFNARAVRDPRNQTSRAVSAHEPDGALIRVQNAGSKSFVR
jgi:hypothetical protein